MKDSEDIEFKPLDSGLGFHARRSSSAILSPLERDGSCREEGTLPPPPSCGGGQPPSSHHPSLSTADGGFFLPAPAAQFFIDQFFILSIFFLLCSIPIIQFQLLKQPFASLLQMQILASFGILLAVVEVFYYLFFKQFKLPSFGKWIIERKLKPQRR